MEKFRKKIQKRIIGMSILLIGIGVFYFLLQNSYTQETASIPAFIQGFHTGAFCGVELTLIYFTVKYLVMMKEDTLLKKLYIEENDERTLMIMQKTGATGMTLCIMGLAAGTVIAGFFDSTVFFTLLAATLFSALMKGAFKLYYHVKM